MSRRAETWYTESESRKRADHRLLQEIRPVQTSPLVSILFVGGCLAAPAIQVSASELNGTIKGSVDGHKIDVKAACDFDKNKPWQILRAFSDPAHHVQSLRDVNGDGITVMADAWRGAGRAMVSVKVGEALYRFSGISQEVTYSDRGFRVAAKINRTEGQGKDRRVVGSYQVDLTFAC